MTIDVATRFGVYDMAGYSDIRDLGHLDGRSFIEVYSDHYEGGLTDGYSEYLESLSGAFTGFGHAAMTKAVATRFGHTAWMDTVMFASRTGAIHNPKRNTPLP